MWQPNTTSDSSKKNPNFPPLQSQVPHDMSETTRRRRGRPLPPQPSSLIRASAVCRRWRSITTDPRFLGRFRAHHRKPPLLGAFEYIQGDLVFTSLLDRPDRIPPGRFDLGRYSDHRDYGVLGFRHGRVLVLDHVRKDLVVCAPVTGEQRRVAVPPEFKTVHLNGAVLCAAGDPGHVHGECHSSPFKVALVSLCRHDYRPLASVYSSDTGAWSNLVSTAAPCQLFDAGMDGSLVGKALYWLLTTMEAGIVEFDLEEQSLVVIKGPPVTDDFPGGGTHRIIQAEDGAVGFAMMSYPHFQTWQRNVDAHGVATWVPWKTVDLRNIFGPRPQIGRTRRMARLTRGWDYVKGTGGIMCYVEDTDVIFIHMDVSVYMIQLNSMQSKSIPGKRFRSAYHPFMSFYTPGTAIAGGYNEDGDG
ncbi:hypothetical protein CFC21_075973 [Triticum aestivum]|uniref:F-box domain-containing protein n=4 Tax=Triticinae TaxID=1648030 RepID=A0A9R1HR18_WHEAT|nr:hypothetical protein CFC21_075973 [Triticum aestivum]